jgi:O-antigen/teichoic acid export membrane protein
VSVDERASPEERLGRQAASGVLWLVAQKWLVRVSGLVALAVLTRQLSTAQFGVVAAAMTVIPMVYLLADLGFSSYLLQAEEVDDRSLSTAFWASAAAGAVLSGGLFVAAPLLAAAFRTPDLEPVLRVLVLAVVPTVLAGVPLALLRRAMAFRAVAMQGAVAAVLAQVVAVVLALRGAGVWSLVAQVAITQWVIAVLAWRRVRWLPSLSLSPGLFREMAVFGVRVSGVDVVATARVWAEAWIITVSLGAPALGVLSIAQRLVMVAQELTAASLVPVSTVLFAKVRQSGDRLGRTYLKGLGVVYGVVSPVMTLLVVTAPVLVPLMFGDRWVASVVPAQALAVAGIITLGAMLDHGLFYGLGRPGTWLAYAVVVDAATVGTTAVAVGWGLPGVAVGFVVVAAAATMARWLLVTRLVRLPVRSVVRPLLQVAIPTLAAVVVGTVVLDAASSSAGPLAGLLVSGVVTLLLNVLLLRLLAARTVGDALQLLPVPERVATRALRWLRLDAGV